MFATPRGLFVCAWLLIAAAAAGTAQTAPPAPPPPRLPSGSVDERIQRLERLLAETRAEVAALKAASAGSSTDAAKLAEIERRIDILAQEIEAMKIGEAAQGAAASRARPRRRRRSPLRGPPPSRSRRRPEPPRPPANATVWASRPRRCTASSAASRSAATARSCTRTSPRRTRAASRPASEDQITDLRAVVYLGYKFDDHFVLNTELEYENAVVASDKGGEAEVEFAYIDYMHSRPFNARAGLVLIPMGLINEQHEPTAFLGARRNDVEDVIIPSTWRELGWGLYGEAGPFSYRGYMVNGLNAAGYDAEEGIREGRQEGSEALAENWAFTGRLDFVCVPGLLVGASVFTGNSGQGHFTPSGQKVHGATTVADAHLDWRWRGLWLRGLYAHTWISEADLINQMNGLEGDESIGSRQEGWYVQGGYDVLSLMSGARASLIPFARYEEYDTQKEVPVGYARNPENDRQELTLGLMFKPIDRLAFKADWQQRHNAAGTGVNQWNLALGYIF